MNGGAGDDHFFAKDGSVDTLTGGIGTDTASLSNNDRDSNDTNAAMDIENWT